MVATMNGHRLSPMNPIRHKLRADDHLAVLCWCQFTTVLVPAAEIRAGRTGCCDSDYCRRLGKEAAMLRR